MYNQFKTNPQEAAKFFTKIMEKWGGIVREAARANNIPEGLIWSSIFAEMVNFGWADYNDAGASLGPGQLTAASRNYYGVPQRWNEKPSGIDMTRGAIFIKRLHSLEELEQITLPSHQQVNTLVFEIYSLSWILSMQAKEIALASSGGGTLAIPGKEGIIVPAMNDGFLTNSSVPIQEDLKAWMKPVVGSNNFHTNLSRLSFIMVAMNRENPGATENTEDGAYYTLPLHFAGQQTNFLYLMFKDKFFELDNNGNLKVKGA